MNLYEYVGGRAVDVFDPHGTGYCDDLSEKIDEDKREIAAERAAAIAHMIQLLTTKGSREREMLARKIAMELAQFVIAKNALEIDKSIYDLLCNWPTICPTPVPDTGPVGLPE